MNAQGLVNDSNYRFTIREAGGKGLRKLMTGSRFLEKRAQYIGRSGIRVDVLNMTNGSVQTWNLNLDKWFGSN